MGDYDVAHSTIADYKFGYDDMTRNNGRSLIDDTITNMNWTRERITEMAQKVHDEIAPAVNAGVSALKTELSNVITKTVEDATKAASEALSKEIAKVVSDYTAKVNAATTQEKNDIAILTGQLDALNKKSEENLLQIKEVQEKASALIGQVDGPVKTLREDTERKYTELTSSLSGTKQSLDEAKKSLEETKQLISGTNESLNGTKGDIEEIKKALSLVNKWQDDTNKTIEDAKGGGVTEQDVNKRLEEENTKLKADIEDRIKKALEKFEAEDAEADTNLSNLKTQYSNITVDMANLKEAMEKAHEAVMADQKEAELKAAGVVKQLQDDYDKKYNYLEEKIERIDTSGSGGRSPWWS